MPVTWTKGVTTARIYQNKWQYSIYTYYAIPQNNLKTKILEEEKKLHKTKFYSTSFEELC